MKIKFAFALAEAFNHFKNIRKSAFTLAEVLVTLAVIGIVAAMTIPTLMNNYQKDVYVTSLHKVYNELDQALQRRMTDSNANDLTQAGLTSQDAVNTWVKNYFKVNTICEGSATNCLGDITGYKKLKSSFNFMTERANENFYALANGAVISPLYHINNDPNCTMAILVDVNAGNKPNVLGRDVFFMYIYNNGGIDDSLDNADTTIDAPMTNAKRDTAFADCNNNSNGNTQVHGCFGQILKDDWQMNY